MGMMACSNADSNGTESDASVSETNQDNNTSNQGEESIDAGVVSNGKSAENNANAQNPEPVFAFEETVFDFGKLVDGEIVTHKFKFKNVGNAPLIISDISTTCGCTSPEYSKDPIQPGEMGEILIEFNSAGKVGQVTKNITVIANTNPVQKLIQIKAQVDPS